MRTHAVILLLLGSAAVLTGAWAQQNGAADIAITAQHFVRQPELTQDRQLLQDNGKVDEVLALESTDLAALPERSLLDTAAVPRQAPRKMLTPKPQQGRTTTTPSRHNTNNNNNSASKPSAATRPATTQRQPATGGAVRPVQKRNNNNNTPAATRTNQKPAVNAGPNRQSQNNNKASRAGQAKPKAVTFRVAPSKPNAFITPAKASSSPKAATLAKQAATPLTTAAATKAAGPAIAAVPGVATAAMPAGAQQPVLERYRGRSSRRYGGYGYGGYSGRSWGGNTYSMAGHGWKSYKATCAHAGTAHACSFTR